MPGQGQIRPRVFRRIMDGIALVWLKRFLNEDQQKNFVVCIERNDNWLPVKLAIASDYGIKIKEQDAEMVFIPHDTNGLSPNEDYHIKIMYGSQDKVQIEARFPVYATSVLPPDERDDSRRNQHIYGFVQKKRKWYKFPLVEWQGQLVVPIVIMNASELKEGNAKRIVLPAPIPLEEKEVIKTNGE